MSQTYRFSLLLALVLLMGCNSRATGEIRDISFSPDNKFIAVSYASADLCVIYKIPLVGSSNPIRLTQATVGCETDPVYSADGKFVVYSYAPNQNAHSQIMVAQADGSNVRTLTNTAADDFFPSFNARDGKIYFARSEFFGHYSPIASSHHHEWDIYSIDPSGSNLTKLTNAKFYEVSRPSLSPDGKSLIFTTIGTGGSKITIRSLETPTKTTVVLQPHVPGEPQSPIFGEVAFMPDGKA